MINSGLDDIAKAKFLAGEVIKKVCSEALLLSFGKVTLFLELVGF